MLKDALLYPWDDGEAGTTLVAGGVLTLLGVLVLPALVVLGYGLRVLEAELAGDDGPPPLEEWSRLLVDGARVAVVLLAYVVVPLAAGAAIVAAVLGQFGLRMGGIVVDPAGAAALGGLALLGAVVVAALALVLLYVAPAAVVRLARSRRLRDAFAFGEVRRLAGTDAYASAWLVSLVVLAAQAVVIAVLNAVSIGVVLSGFVGFYAFVAISALYARGARQAGVGVGDQSAADEG